MRTFTNRYDLPDSVVRAVTYSDYEKGNADISVTGLLKPPQLAYLEALHEDEIEEDISEGAWRLLGSALHEVMRRAAPEEEVLSEKRLFTEARGWQVSGQIDRYDLDGTLEDFKCTSIWTVIFEPKGRREWHEQLNLYALLLRRHGYPVRKLRIISVLRDHNKREAKENKRGDYPPIPFKVINIPLWNPEDADEFLEERVRLHQAGRLGAYSDCTPEETWFNQRTGRHPRCDEYCAASDWCVQRMARSKKTS